MTHAYPIVDVDNHYYEPDDCFTRFIEPEYADRACHIVRRDDGVGVPYIGKQPAYYLGATPADLMGRPGVHAAAKDLRYRPLGEEDLLRPREVRQFYDRDERVRWMDEQEIEAVVMWPSLGLGVEWQLRDDPDACIANLRSFNRWIDEIWGFDHRRRIFAVPTISLIDLEAALRELDVVLARGARLVHLLFTTVGGRTIGHPYFDPFWARLAEAEVPVAFHGAEAGYCDLFSAAFGEPQRPPANRQSAFQRAVLWERPIMDTLAALILHNVFGRFPALQAISVENGSAWVSYLLRVMDKAENTGSDGEWIGGRISHRPSEIFRQHVSVAPFDDDDIRGLVDLLGADRVLLGSDYPHPEGIAAPRSFLDGHGLSDEETRLVSRENTARLLEL